MAQQSAILVVDLCQTTDASSFGADGDVSWSPSPGLNRQSRTIVFILADDLGYADVSCYGQRDYTTPNIDGCNRGIEIRAGYSNSPDCSATRTALITGAIKLACRLGSKSRFLLNQVPEGPAWRQAIRPCHHC